MNEIRASFKVTDKEILGKLIVEFSSRTLFGDNKKLTVKGDEVTLYALFDELPENLINYIVKGDDLKIEYNTVNEKKTENEEKTEETERVDTDKIKKETKKNATFDAELPEKVKEIIQNNSDKSEVAIQINNCLNAGIYANIFTALISNKLNDFNVSIINTYKDIENITDVGQLTSKCNAFSTGIKNRLKKIGYNGTATTFLDDVFQYYNSIWSNNKEEEKIEKQQSREESNEDDDETDEDDTIEVSEVKEKPKIFKGLIGLPPNKIVEQKLKQMPEDISKKEKIKYIFDKALNANISNDIVEDILKSLENDKFVLTKTERMVIATAISRSYPGTKSEEFLKSLKEFIN